MASGRIYAIATWRAAGALAILLAATLSVALTYVLQPQSPRDFIDRIALSVRPQAYGPNLRVAERQLRRAVTAEGEGKVEIAESLRWEAAHGFAGAGESTPDGRDALAANNRAARIYLALGWTYLERGRGGILGIGRSDPNLEGAEVAAACVAGLAPTQARAAINRFLVELEEELERPPAGSCPR